MRETARDKADRLLLAGAVTVLRVERREVRALVRGDSGAFYLVEHEPGFWTCTCPSLGLCGHRLAVQRVAPAGVHVVAPETMVTVG